MKHESRHPRLTNRGRIHRVGPRSRILAWSFRLCIAVSLVHSPALAQQAATPSAPLFNVNAKYVQGVGPGYWPTAGAGLTLNLAAGTAHCNVAVVSYGGGTLTLAASQTNYVDLDPTNNCAPASNTTGFTGSQIPIAKVVTGASSITSITDLRSWFSDRSAVLRLNGIRFADQFLGGSVGAQIDAACSDLGGSPGLAVIPSTMAAGNSLSGLPDNCRALDLRGASGPNEYGDEGTAHLKDVLLRARWADAPVTVQNYQTLHLHAEPFAGGTNQTGGPKTNYSTLATSMAARTPGQHLGVNASVNNFSDGDTVAYSGTAFSWGAMNAGGDEGTEALTAHAEHGPTSFTATLSSVTDNGSTYTLAYSSPVNENTRGVNRYAINTTPARVYTTGSVTNISASRAVTFSGTALDTQFGLGAHSDLCFSPVAEDNGTLKLVMPVLTVDSATQLTFDYSIQGSQHIWSGTTSGNYRIYYCGKITSLALSGSLNVNKGATNWAAGDSIETPPSYAGAIRGGVVTVKANLRTPMGLTGLTVWNQGTFSGPVSAGLVIDGNWERGLLFNPNYGSLGLYGITFNDVPTAIFMNQPTSNSLLGWTWASGTATVGVDRTTGTFSVNTSKFAVNQNAEASVGTSPQTGWKLWLNPTSTSDKGLMVSSPASATGTLLDLDVAGVPIFRVTPSSTFLTSATPLYAYSDNQATEQWRINSSTTPFFKIGTSAAASGTIRLASSGALNFRNNANGADVNGLSKGSDDVVQVGGAAGAKTAGKFFTPVNTVSYSATPTFDASLGNTQKITLAGNVTSSTLSNASPGEQINFIICQDATGNRTFAWPANVLGGMTIGSTASKCSAQGFVFDGANAYALSPGVTNM